MTDLALLDYEVADGVSPWLDVSRLKYGVGANVVVPWSIVRSALISSKTFQRAPRPIFKRDTPIAAWGDVRVSVKGEQLDQDDFDVFTQIIRMSLDQSVRGEVVTVRFGVKELLRAIGGPDADVGGAARKRVHERLYRLMDNSYTFHIPGLLEDRVHLINRVTSNIGNNPFKFQVLEYTVQLNSDILAMFAGGRYAVLSSRVRQALRKNNLAQWLHSFFATHTAQVQPFTKTLKGLAGRGTVLDANGMLLVEEQQESKWQADLKKALKLLKEGAGWHSCEIVADKVIVQKVDPAVVAKAKKAVRQAPEKIAASGNPSMQRALWLATLPMAQLERLPLALGYLYGLPLDWSPDERRTAILEDFMDEKHSLEEMQQKLAKAFASADEAI